MLPFTHWFGLQCYYIVSLLCLGSKPHPSGLCRRPVPGNVVPHTGGRETSQTVRQTLYERRRTTGGRSGPFQHHIGGKPHVISSTPRIMRTQGFCLIFFLHLFKHIPSPLKKMPRIPTTTAGTEVVIISNGDHWVDLCEVHIMTDYD